MLLEGNKLLSRVCQHGCSDVSKALSHAETHVPQAKLMARSFLPTSEGTTVLLCYANLKY